MILSADVLEVLQSYLKWAVIPAALYSVYKLCTYLIPGPHRHPKLSFKDKTVLITGASSGLGRALAFELYRRGAKVIVTARSIDKLKGLCEELKRSGIENPHEPSYSYLDVSEPMDVEALKNLAIDGKTIHVLINNAGLSMRGSINDTPISIYKQLMDVNFFGHVVITQKLLNSIPDDGCIIATSSVQGKLPIPYRSAYGASKHAFQAFFDTLRCESRPNMHILTVSAGYMNTGFGKRALDTQGHAVGKEDEKQLKDHSSRVQVAMILDRVQEKCQALDRGLVTGRSSQHHPTSGIRSRNRSRHGSVFEQNRHLFTLGVAQSPVLLALQERTQRRIRNEEISIDIFLVCNYRGYIKLNRSKFERDLRELKEGLERNLLGESSRPVIPDEKEVSNFLRSNAWLLGGFAAGWLLGFGLA
ncbi:hypothetical protein RB195_002308 [Necator americanus]|uniref:Oxidoreductase, short chain dehydrogenase/reductase family protein n=1 Tax=Necator americanus TaxID=51031 RepID=A0ABR1DLA8_NECAM